MEKEMTKSFTISEFVREFNKQLNNVGYGFIHLLDQCKFDSYCKLLDEWYQIALLLKEDAQSKQDEEAANIFFSAQCYCASVIKLFKMWSLIKTNDANEAWNALIDSQEYAKISKQANRTPDAESLSLFLEDIENKFFPKPQFVSGGFTYRAGKCSICNDRFDECAHKEGFVYMGKLCRQVQLRDVSFDHIAFANTPRDKRCRVISIEINGVFVDLFSGEEQPCNEPVTIDGVRANALFIVSKTLPNT